MPAPHRTTPDTVGDDLTPRRWERPDALLAGAQRCGHDIEAILRAAAISRQPSDNGVLINVAAYVALIRLLTERMNDDALGLFSRPLRSGSVVLLLRSALGAPSIETALRRMARAFSLLQEDYRLSVTRHERGICLRIEFLLESVRRYWFADVLVMRSLWRMTTWLSGGEVKAERFELPYEPSIEPTFSQAQYGGKAIYGGDQSVIWFPASAMQLPVCQDEVAFKNFFSNAQWHIFGSTDGQKLSTQIRTLLLRTQPDWLDLPQAARVLNMSGSTVQRRLAAEGCSYQSLKDDLRREIAVARLTGSNVPIKTLAGELGFRDAPSFQRAFKTWTGQPPGQFRREPSPSDHPSSGTALPFKSN